jgi:hypothetical protein
MKYLTTKLIPLLVLLFSMMVACDTHSTKPSSQTPCDKSSSLKGTITQITSGTSANGLVIDSTKEQGVQYSKFYATIKADTHAFKKQGQACRSMSFADLKIGQEVAIQIFYA